MPLPLLGSVAAGHRTIQFLFIIGGRLQFAQLMPRRVRHRNMRVLHAVLSWASEQNKLC
jgi:hypothetical protein